MFPGFAEITSIPVRWSRQAGVQRGLALGMITRLLGVGETGFGDRW